MHHDYVANFEVKTIRFFYRLGLGALLENIVLKFRFEGGPGSLKEATPKECSCDE